MTFKDIALPLAVERNVPVIRLQPASKIASDKSWQDICSTDFRKVMEWDAETPNANCGCVAKPNGVWFFDEDVPGVVARFTQETGIAISTYAVRSSVGRGHYYFLQDDESRKMGNIAQKNSKDHSFSVRQNNEYVVAAGSIHPITGLPYAVLNNLPITPAPSGFVNWILAQRVQSAPDLTSDTGPIPDGARNSSLTSVGGKLRNAGCEHAEIEATLMRMNAERCNPPLSDEEVKIIARSVSRYTVGAVGPQVLIGGKEAGSNPAPKPAPASKEPQFEVISADENVDFVEEVMDEDSTYPFWAWNGTLYEDFADVCGELNFVPKEYFIEAIKTIVGGICGHRITPFKTESQEARFYTVMLGPGGCGKSSAVKWAKNMFIGTGLMYDLAQDGPGAFQNIGCAHGTFGSGSGLVVNGFCKHPRIIQIYDEVSSLIEKFGIQGSGDAFLDAQNELYEHGYFSSNATRSTKNLPSQLVHNSVLGCTTAEKWASAFVRTNSESSGFFQRLNVVTNSSSQRTANFQDPDLSTLRMRFEKKIAPLEFQTVTVVKTEEAADHFENWFRDKQVEWRDLHDDIKGRLQVLVQRNASHIAWLLNGDEVADPGAVAPIEATCDLSVIKAAIALAEYQVESRTKHKPAQGKNDWALVEDAVKTKVKQHQKLSRKDLYKAVHAERYGIQTFDKAVSNLVQEGFIRVGQREGEKKRGRKTQILIWEGE